MSARVWKIDGIASALAPASKVRATTFSLVGRVYHCDPRRELGKPGPEGGEVVGGGFGAAL